MDIRRDAQPSDACLFGSFADGGSARGDTGRYGVIRAGPRRSRRFFLAAARKYYQADGLTSVLLGNAAKIREAADKYAPNVLAVAVSKPGFGGQ